MHVNSSQAMLPADDCSIGGRMAGTQVQAGLHPWISSLTGQIACNTCCLLQMIAALPAGWLADKYRRGCTLKVAAVLGALSGVGLAVTLEEACYCTLLIHSQGIFTAQH